MTDEKEHLRENAVLLGDLVSFFRRKKQALFTISLCMGICCALFSLLMPIKYQITAAFKDSEGGASMSGSNALSMLLQGPKANNSFAALMKSRTLLHKVVEESGIQISEETMPFFFRVLKRIRRNLSSTYNEKIAWAETIRFQNVIFSSEKGGSFLIKGIDEKRFLIRDTLGKEHTGEVGIPITFDGATLTVTSIPQKKIGMWKRHYIQPIDEIIDGLVKSISILPNKLDGSIIEIKMQDGLPIRSISIVNAVMKIYKAHLVAESDRVTREHLENLYEHKQVVQNRIAIDLRRYADQMERNVDFAGFLNPQEELMYLYEHEKKLAETVHSIDKKLLALRQDVPHQAGEFEYRSKLMQQEQQLKMAQNMLDVDIFGKQESFASMQPIETKDPLLLNYLQNTFQQTFPFFHEGQRNTIIERVLAAGSMYPIREKKPPAHGNLHILDEQVLKEYTLSLLKEIQQTRMLQEAFVIARNKLKEKIYDIKSLKIFARELDMPNVVNFDELLIRYENTSHFTDKERAQMEMRVQLVKEMLAKTLDEKIGFLKQKERSIQTEVQIAREAMYMQLEKKHCNIRAYRKHIEEEMGIQLEALKQLSLQQLQKIKERLKKIPEKVVRNTQLQMSSEVDKNIMSHLLQFIESKNMQNKLNTIEARPLDEAYCANKPMKSSMVTFAIAGMGLGGFAGTVGILLLGLMRGLPISGANVRYKGYTYLGTVSKDIGSDVQQLDEADLEKIRAIASVCSAPITAILQGHGPRYAHHVATLLGYRGHRVLLLDLEQKITCEKEKAGLYEYIEGMVETLPTKKYEQYEEISFGKKNRYVTEYLRSEKFQRALEKLQERYTHILLVTRSPLFSDEVLACLSYASSGVLSFREETWEEVRQIRTCAKIGSIPLSFIDY